MTLPGLLNRVHRQRIGVAVKAARAGDVAVTLIVVVAFDGWGGGRLCWICEGKRHEIAAGGLRAMAALLPVAQEEFKRQMAAAFEVPDAIEFERRAAQ